MEMFPPKLGYIHAALFLSAFMACSSDEGSAVVGTGGSRSSSASGGANGKGGSSESTSGGGASAVTSGTAISTTSTSASESAGSSSRSGSSSTGGGGSTGGAGGGGSSASSTGSSTTSGQGTIGSIKNPVIKGFYADPQVAIFGGKYYIYPTTDGVANWGATVFHAFSSTDLANWKDEGVILDLTKVTWGHEYAWAPGITVKNGTYYFYFCDTQQIGVATSNSPTGPFKDALGKPLISTKQYGVASIDPYVFDDDNGRSYLFFGSGSTARGVELNADMKSLKGTPQAITLSGFREGSVVFKRGDTYYYMWSVSGTDKPDYRVSYGTSKSPLGPYTVSSNSPILQSTGPVKSTGHNSILAMPNGDYYIVYHRWASPYIDGFHREVCVDKMTFNADGSIAKIIPTP